MSNGSVYLPHLDFSASPTLSDFMRERSVVRLVWGPTGSGKTTACQTALMGSALQQPPDKEFVRRSRHLLVRNTAPILRTTTVKTWLERFPERHCGPMRWSSPITHHIRIAPKGRSRETDLPGLDAEFIFLALDTPDDIVKLKSFDTTSCFFHEASEIPPTLIVYMTRRLGRYPAKDGDYEAFEPFIVADSNATDGDNPLVAFEREAPARWRFFKQPPAVLEVDAGGLCLETDPLYGGRRYEGQAIHTGAGRHWVVNPDAENLRNLRAGYYPDSIGGSSLEAIQRDLQVKFIYVQDGRAVVPEFSQQVHIVDSLDLLEGVPLELGGDIGGGTLNPAAVIGQLHAAGVWLIHDELICPDVALADYSTLLHAKLAQAHLKSDGVPVGRFHGDPAGATRDPLFGTVIFDHLRAAGFRAQPAPSNDIDMRIQAVRGPFTRMIRGKPGILIHRRCKVLIQALAGKWKYRKMMLAGEPRYVEKPDKTHPYSDVADALGYLLLGGGEERVLRGRQPVGPFRAAVAATDFDIFRS